MGHPFTQGFYSRQCKAELEPVLETLRWLKHESSVWLEVTTLLIPGLNDSDAELHALCEWFVQHLGPGVPLHFTAFHPDFKLVERPPTPHATLQRARSIAHSVGLQYVYLGNVDDPDAHTTYCPSCRTPVIERRGYDVVGFRLGAGKCSRCGTVIPGHFDAAPGDWGSKRRRLFINQPHQPAR